MHFSMGKYRSIIPIVMVITYIFFGYKTVGNSDAHIMSSAPSIPSGVWSPGGWDISGDKPQP